MFHLSLQATKLQDALGKSKQGSMKPVFICALGVPVLRHEEKKPSGGAALASHLHPIPADKIAFVGDRILTDVVFGNLNGNFTIWTRKIVTETGDNKAALIVS